MLEVLSNTVANIVRNEYIDTSFAFNTNTGKWIHIGYNLNFMDEHWALFAEENGYDEDATELKQVFNETVIALVNYYNNAITLNPSYNPHDDGEVIHPSQMADDDCEDPQ